MDPKDQFQPTARELLERHIAENNQPNRERGAVPESTLTPEHQATRPTDINYAERRSDDGYDQGGMDRQGPAAIRSNNRNNAEYFEHVRQAGQARQEQRQDGDKTHEALKEHMENTATEPGNRTSAREALEQHFRDAAGEVTQHNKTPFVRDRDKQHEHER